MSPNPMNPIRGLFFLGRRPPPVIMNHDAAADQINARATGQKAAHKYTAL